MPNLSESIPAGMLAIIPVKADTAATIPTTDGRPEMCGKSGSTGLFDMVELNMAKSPVVQRIEKD